LEAHQFYPDFVDQETQDQVRNKSEGRGLLYPDTFSEERLIFLPPAASALLVILSRNHNVRLLYIISKHIFKTNGTVRGGDAS
jgi:hypothetical protein